SSGPDTAFARSRCIPTARRASSTSSARAASRSARSRRTRSCARSARRRAGTRRRDGRNERTEDGLMPQTLTYPGVYIEEVPSAVRPITGVATSITAFVGRALRGPVDDAITITSYGDFERIFGGLWLDSNLGYAVQDFYRNGGSTAIVVRVHKTKANDTASMTLGSGNRALALQAASPGTWGSKLSASIDNDVS